MIEIDDFHGGELSLLAAFPTSYLPQERLFTQQNAFLTALRRQSTTHPRKETCFFVQIMPIIVILRRLAKLVIRGTMGTCVGTFIARWVFWGLRGRAIDIVFQTVLCGRPSTGVLV